MIKHHFRCKSRWSTANPPMYDTRLFVPVWLFLLWLIPLFTGCDNTIEPYAEKGRYSIYGYLSPARDVQMVRVKPLTVPISKMDSADLGVTVTLENLTDGTNEILRDSVIAYQDEEASVITHNFWTDSAVQLGSKYRISVKDPNGDMTTATAVAPTGSEAITSPENGNCLSTYTVEFEDVTVRRISEASIQAFYEGEWISLSPSSENIYRTDERNAALNFKPETLLEDHIPEQTVPESRNPFCWFATRCGRLGSDSLRIRYTYLGPEWYGEIPEDSLTYNPLKSHDVTNGLGFFGALGQAQTVVSVDTARFIPVNDGFCDH